MAKVLNQVVADDLLARLTGWGRDTAGISRTIPLSGPQYAELRERVKVCADAMRLRPVMVRDGEQVRFTIVRGTSDGITDNEVALAARINDVIRAVTGRDQFPGEEIIRQTPTDEGRGRRWWRASSRVRATS